MCFLLETSAFFGFKRNGWDIVVKRSSIDLQTYQYSILCTHTITRLFKIILMKPKACSKNVNGERPFRMHITICHVHR